MWNARRCKEECGEALFTHEAMPAIFCVPNNRSCILWNLEECGILDHQHEISVAVFECNVC